MPKPSGENTDRHTYLRTQYRPGSRINNGFILNIVALVPPYLRAHMKQARFLHFPTVMIARVHGKLLYMHV